LRKTLWIPRDEAFQLPIQPLAAEFKFFLSLASFGTLLPLFGV